MYGSLEKAALVGQLLRDQVLPAHATDHWPE